MGYRRYVVHTHTPRVSAPRPANISGFHYLIGQEEFDRLRSLSYAETHVVMICFSVRCSGSTYARANPLVRWIIQHR